MITLPSDWSVMVVLVVKDRKALRGTRVALKPNLDNMVSRLDRFVSEVFCPMVSRGYNRAGHDYWSFWLVKRNDAERLETSIRRGKMYYYG